jgi:hypothetical protein
VADLEAHAIGSALDVPELQGVDFRHPQAGGVGGHQRRSPAQGSRRVDSARDLFAREDLRQPFGHLRHRDVEAGLRKTVHAPTEKAQRTRSLVDTGTGELPVANQVQQPGLHLLDAQLCRRSMVEHRQIGDRADTGFLRPCRHATQGHRVAHSFTQLTHGLFLDCRGDVPRGEEDRGFASELANESSRLRSRERRLKTKVRGDRCAGVPKPAQSALFQRLA